MKISYNWLRDFVEVDIPVEQVADILTDTGLEVSGVETYHSIPGGLEGLVVGQVTERTKHPDADKLVLTKVDTGKGEPVQIVCGAPNVDIGQKVIVAPVGSTIHHVNGETLTLKKAKIRGEVSEGMICAEDEVSLGMEHDGIVVLDPSTRVGTPVKDLYECYSDEVIEIDLTPNRIDGASHYGVARDLVAALQNSEFRIDNLELRKADVSGFKDGDAKGLIEVVVEDEKACSRYAGLSIQNVKVKESPAWLQNRLKAIGQKPINNVVDVTNYLLHELGQPLHAFDADKVAGNKVVVKKLAKGTKFTTLDKEERELHEDDLMICDAEKGMCIAGVFGGIDSGVTETTKNIFLESAYFNPVHVRKTAKRHGLNTDASFRFERGVDPNMTITALKKVALLIKETAGGEITGEIIDHYPNPIEPFKVDLSFANCTRLIGKEIALEKIKSILSALEIEVENETEEGLSLSVPPYRVDVNREADVIEEVLRIYGYNNVEIPEKVNSSLSYSKKPDKNQLQRNISGFLAANGFNEIMVNSLTQSKHYPKIDPLVQVLNPLSNELDVLRQSLLFGGLEVIGKNINHKQENLKLFEFGNCYYKTKEGHDESANLTLFATGRKETEQWNSDEAAVDFHYLKGLVAGIFQKLGIGKAKEQALQNEQLSNAIELTSGKIRVAEIGSVNNKLLSRFDIEQPVICANIIWDNVLEVTNPHPIHFKAIPKYPAVRRDLALLLDEKTAFSEIEKLAKSNTNNLLQEVGIFDVYKGKGIENGKKSYAVSFTFQDLNQTLTDEMVDAEMKKLQKVFEEKLGASLR